MKYRYKLVPVDRATLKRPFETKDVAAQFEVDVDEMHRVLSRVNPPRGLAAVILNDDQDKQLLAGSMARMLSEMFGGDVYFQPLDGGDRWEMQPNVWRPER